MRLGRLRFWCAAVVAFLLGIPFTEKAVAQGFDVFLSSLDLGLAIADSAGSS